MALTVPEDVTRVRTSDHAIAMDQERYRLYVKRVNLGDDPCVAYWDIVSRGPLAIRKCEGKKMPARSTVLRRIGKLRSRLFPNALDRARSLVAEILTSAARTPAVTLVKAQKEGTGTAAVRAAELHLRALGVLGSEPQQHQHVHMDLTQAQAAAREEAVRLLHDAQEEGGNGRTASTRDP